MNATSAATPTISGIVSLMKQMNKKLTVPQIKYILAKTARNDKTFSTMSVGRVTGQDVDNNNIVLNNGWIDKNNGLRYSEWYGFGLADAGEAVKLAKNCDSDEYCKKREKTAMNTARKEKKLKAVLSSQRQHPAFQLPVRNMNVPSVISTAMQKMKMQMIQRKELLLTVLWKLRAYL